MGFSGARRAARVFTAENSIAGSDTGYFNIANHAQFVLTILLSGRILCTAAESTLTESRRSRRCLYSPVRTAL